MREYTVAETEALIELMKEELRLMKFRDLVVLYYESAADPTLGPQIIAKHVREEIHTRNHLWEPRE